ncbi:sulfite exporter TauE/SafE family protein [Streptococcus parauberis]|uniref:sulfite exporter TauE/SafE family protein n=1 Tax=Streptococcus parauberis TaxID=1348 RepID=UPI0028900E52|nr:sulfite exporter TauE/SafE family protein [Streptococcus parauberis]MDT2750086.1 sulfite exporter TauE/SafE family protein [Streptococcus parauberis]
MIAIIYGLIVFLATTIGATTGAGGGAIIKPVFDLIGIDTVTIISIYSTVAVFSMCLSSLYKHAKSGKGFDKIIMLLLASGSLMGGYLGDKIFKFFTQTISNEKVTVTQSLLLFIVLVSVLIFTSNKEKFPSYHVRNKLAIFSFGVAVGALSVFIGFGGGPLNIIVLLGFMSMTAKESTAYSIGMIFFAQFTKIISIISHGNSVDYNPIVIPIIVITAILGGYVGTKINHLFTDKQVTLMYSILMTCLLVTCGINIVTNL